MKKNFKVLLNMVYPMLFCLYMIYKQVNTTFIISRSNTYTVSAGSDVFLFIFLGLGIIFAVLSIIGLIGTLKELFSKKKVEVSENTQNNEESNSQE